MPRHWFLGLIYSLIAALNVYHQGFRSARWAPWALMAVGALTLVYLPAEEGKPKPKIMMSMRNKAAIGAMLSGILLLGFQVLHH